MKHRSYPKKSGFRLGIYVFKDVEIVDFAAPHGVFSVARRFDAELEAFLIADALRPVQAQAGFTYCRTTPSPISRPWMPFSFPAVLARVRS
jgi:transcriptional regulator GlxA family with amidase domain